MVVVNVVFWLTVTSAVAVALMDVSTSLSPSFNAAFLSARSFSAASTLSYVLPEDKSAFVYVISETFCFTVLTSLPFSSTE